MSPELGYAYFAESPIYGTAPILDGVPWSGLPRPLRKVPSGAAHVLQHASGDVTLQLDYRDAVDPDGDSHYSWPLVVQAREEAIWWLIERLWKSRRIVYWIPWGQEEESFTAGVSLDTFRLPRIPASAVSDHPDVGSYPTLAWVDDVAQTVIASGTPGAGEVKVVGRIVTTPALTVGQVLRIRYAPAYEVALTECGAEEVSQFNEVSRPVTLTETRESLA